MVNGQNTVIYAALAVMLLVVLGSSFYSFSQLNSINGKISDLEKQGQGSTQNQAAIAALQTRIQALESKVLQQSVTSKMLLFYDSSCATCSNEQLLLNLDDTRAKLATQGIGLQSVDIKDTPNSALAVGVRNVPVFFASSADLASSPRLVEFFNSLPQIKFALQEIPQGLIAYPPLTSKVIASNCSQPGAVTLEEFYSTTCPFCRPVFYANGTRYNDPIKDVRFSSLSEDAAKNVSAAFGSKLSLNSRCVNVHTLQDNQQMLNVNESDEALCIKSVGQTAYDENELASANYGISGAPSFVIDCQYISKVREPDKLQKAICDARPDVCAGLNTSKA